MLQVIESFTAKKSPCHNCQSHLTDTYPYCSKNCNKINKYLLYLNDIPYKKPEKNLDKKFMPERRAGCPADLTTEAECAEACNWLRELKEKTGWPVYRLSEEIGISTTYFNCLYRNGQKIMDKVKYRQIMGYKLPSEF